MSQRSPACSQQVKLWEENTYSSARHNSRVEGAGGDACEGSVICDTGGLKAKIASFLIVKVKASALRICILPVWNEWRSSLLADDKQE